MPIKNLDSSIADELRPEYDLASLKGGVQGKYYARATAGTTMVLLEPDVAEAYSDGASGNPGAALLPPRGTWQPAPQGAAAGAPESAPAEVEARKAPSRLSADR